MRYQKLAIRHPERGYTLANLEVKQGYIHPNQLLDRRLLMDEEKISRDANEVSLKIVNSRL